MGQENLNDSTVGDEGTAGIIDPPAPPPVVNTSVAQPTVVEEKDPIKLKIAEYEANERDKDEPDMPVIPEGASANVRLAKSREHDALPSGRTNIGLGVTVIVPKKDKQLAGFYTPNAKIFVHQFPQYKLFVAKGE